MQEACTAYYSFSGAVAPSDKACDNGLGFSVTTTGNGSYGTGTCSGSKYTIKQNPGSSFSLPAPCNAFARVAGQGANTPLNAYSQGSAYVNYQAQAYNVRVAVGGLTHANGTDNVLIGQGVQASLATDAPVTFSNYSWSTNDTYTFSSFDMASDQSWGHMTPCPASTWTSATPGWFWYVEGDGTVNCSATVTVTATGQNLSTVTVSRPITVWTPYSKLTAVPGNVNYTTGQTKVLAGTDWLVRPYGIEWTGSVGTEDMFQGQGYGNWCFMQLFSMNRAKTYFDVPDWSLTTNNALDGAFSIYGNYPPANSDALFHTHASEDDNPWMPLPANTSRFYVSDNWKLWMMYQPPDTSYGVRWVPIQSLTWQWNTSGTRTTTAPFAPAPPVGNVTADSSTPEHQFPSWATKYP